MPKSAACVLVFILSFIVTPFIEITVFDLSKYDPRNLKTL